MQCLRYHSFSTPNMVMATALGDYLTWSEQVIAGVRGVNPAWK
ncbi:MAG: hypothetical protein R3E08_06100 [Thiotrichaceae bacterium]